MDDREELMDEPNPWRYVQDVYDGTERAKRGIRTLAKDERFRRRVNLKPFIEQLRSVIEEIEGYERLYMEDVAKRKKTLG